MSFVWIQKLESAKKRVNRQNLKNFHTYLFKNIHKEIKKFVLSV